MKRDAEGWPIPEEGLVVPTRHELALHVAAMIGDAVRHVGGNPDDAVCSLVLGEQFAQYLDAIYARLDG